MLGRVNPTLLQLLALTQAADAFMHKIGWEGGIVSAIKKFHQVLPSDSMPVNR